jgi:hypothetical protein
MEDSMLRFGDVRNVVITGTIVRYTPRPNGPPDSVTMSVEGYETDVNALLTSIRWTWAGWALMMDIWRCRRRNMLIIPWSELPHYNRATNSWDGFNATAQPVTMPELVDNPVDMGEVRAAAADAPRHALVRYNPAMWNPQTVAGVGFVPSAADFRQAPGVERDEILLHEMVHALRQMRGTTDFHQPLDAPHYDTVEEFMAIVVSNVFRSERHRPGLRRDHWGFQALPADQQADPNVFLSAASVGGDSNRARMLQLRRDGEQFFNDMKRSPAAWNPFRLM